MIDEADDAEPEFEIPNAAEPKAIKRQRDTAKRREREAAQFWQALFADKVARRELWGILQSGHAFDERFELGPTGFPNEPATWLRAGEQRLAFRLYLSWMRLDPDGVALMLRENDPEIAAATKAARR